MKRSTSDDRCLYARSWRALLALLAVVGLIAGALGVTGAFSVSSRPVLAAGPLPCDIYASGNTPCVAAHSTVRALLSSYNGNLYQVRRQSDGATTNIGTLGAGGFANAAAQDSFCTGTTCTITIIFDQSGRGNNLIIEGPGGNGGQDVGANAALLPIMIAGHKAYGLFVSAGVGYRNDATSGVARNGQPEGEYMVASSSHVNSGCCFDYGNAETNNNDNGNGHMDAVNFGTLCWFPPCTGSGPWVLADMENGLFSGANGNNPNNQGNNSPFVTALIKNNGQNMYAIKGGNAQSGGLSTWYSGPEPNIGGYSPMHQEGAIVLGTGGDNSNSSIGTFFEGVMTAGFPSDATDNSVQASIVSAYSTASPFLFGTWNQCASENGTCSFSGTMTVAYGAGGKFNYGTFTNGTGCNNTVFGDPNPGVGKACFVEPVPPATNIWSQCASENGTCGFSGTMTVAYGAGGKFNYRTLSNGTGCNNSVFGDPNVGVGKACFLIAAPPNTVGWTLCTNEAGTCAFSGTHEVAYGANGQFFYRSVSSSVGCNNGVFGDPDSGIVKSCYFQ